MQDRDKLSQVFKYDIIDIRYNYLRYKRLAYAQ